MRFVALVLSVLCLNLFAFITIRLRPRLFNVKIYKPMLWNFKLSVLPIAILAVNIAVFMLLSILGAYADIPFILTFAYVLFFIGLLFWLVFMPNSGYLITELNLSHRTEDENDVPIWYDIVSVLAFAMSGIVNTLLNIVILQTSFLVVFDPPELNSGSYAVLFFSGFGIICLMVAGIYLGRVLRYNSWDVLHPHAFIKKLKEHFSEKGTLKEFALYVAINVLFFLIMYVSFGIPFYFM